MNQVPAIIIMYISSYLKFHDILNLRSVNKKINNIIIKYSSLLDTVYKPETDIKISLNNIKYYKLHEDSEHGVIIKNYKQIYKDLKNIAYIKFILNFNTNIDFDYNDALFPRLRHVVIKDLYNSQGMFNCIKSKKILNLSNLEIIELYGLFLLEEDFTELSKTVKYIKLNNCFIKETSLNMLKEKNIKLEINNIVTQITPCIF